jgi:uncharacterized protein (DUF1697 family)
MARYAAFLRGVMPTLVTMPALRAAFEAAGFTGVRTVLGSGNVVFSARATPAERLERKADAAVEAALGRSFPSIVRPLDALQALLASDPYAGLRVAPAAKRVVTFLRARPRPAPTLPVEQDGARLLRLSAAGTELLSAYLPSPRGPVFMVLIERALGKDVTTRTWETVGKVVAAGEKA